MIILWIQNRKKQKSEPEKEIDNFKAHDEVMRKFREAHKELDMISDRDILTGDGNLLAPVHHIKLSDHIQN